MNPNSKDILVIKEEINGLDIRLTVHHSDTISVVIGCSYSPVAVDISGVIRLSNALTLILSCALVLIIITSYAN